MNLVVRNLVPCRADRLTPGDTITDPATGRRHTVTGVVLDGGRVQVRAVLLDVPAGYLIEVDEQPE